MTDDADALRAALREAEDLITHLRQRTTQLHAALLRTAQELADARDQLDENPKQDDDKDG